MSVRSNLWLLVLVSLCPAGLFSQAASPGKIPARLAYDKQYSADDILNGTTLGRPPSPPSLPVTYDATGFAEERLFHVPVAGVHPRILFGPEDLPEIRHRLQSTGSGRQMLAFVRKQLANGIDKPGTWEHRLYTDLLKGDLTDFGAIYTPGNSALVAGNSRAPRETLKPATKWHHRDSFGVAMEMKAFICMLDDNRAEGARLGQALAEWAAYYKPRVEAAAAGPYGDNWWRSMRAPVDQWPFLPYAYDFNYNFMTPAQQSAVRDVLSLITKGRYSLGMDLPAHWRNWNFLGMSMYEVIFSLAIEGEPGYDPRIYHRAVEVTRDFLDYAINPSGMAHESVGYHSAAMVHFSQFMIAMANRGQNLFLNSHYRAQLDQWYLQTLQPYGGEWFSDGDLGNFPPSDESLMVARHFFPDDERLDYVFQNLKSVHDDNFASDFFMVPMLITASDPRRDGRSKLVDYHAGADFHLPATYADEHRGVVITRSDWSRDALYLNFECHPDTTFASHDHADRGRFVLTALGRNWAWQDNRPHETGQTNAVTIDGAGEGYFATFANWLGMSDTSDATFAGCDARYAYDWKWLKESAMWSPDDPRLKLPHYMLIKQKIDERNGTPAEYDPSPSVVAYYADYLKGNPLMWDEDSWVVRQPNNPVEFAFRSAGIVRGEHAYALIVDDIQKDDATHHYEWNMQLEPDIYLLSQSSHDGVLDVILAEKNGHRRLLLRFFDPEGLDTAKGAYTEHYGGAYNMAGVNYQAPDMYRLVVPTRAVTYHSKTLLFAFREGDPLPRSQWNTSAASATVGWADQQDTILFRTNAGGRAVFVVKRDGRQIADVQ